jgi:monoamine oxidase
MAPFWPVVREGLERIAFAGEHTEALAGFMESAVRSGHRAASRLGAAADSRMRRRNPDMERAIGA